MVIGRIWRFFGVGPSAGGGPAGNATQVIAMLDDLGRSIDTYAASLDDAAAGRRDVLAVNHGKRGWRLLV
jgi:hypothetical protein